MFKRNPQFLKTLYAGYEPIISVICTCNYFGALRLFKKTSIFYRVKNDKIQRPYPMWNWKDYGMH